jgi:hypothetical protein
MSIPLTDVRVSNAALQYTPPLVTLFVGGTSGISESTLRALSKNAPDSRIYIIGRSEEAAQKISSEVPNVNFLKANVDLISEVDRVCDIIKEKEKVLNCLMMTCGIGSLKGRTETVEGIDRKMALHYYSRMRFTFNLLPLLRAAGEAKPPQLARVLSVLDPNRTGNLILDDLDLKHNFSVLNCATHNITMNSVELDSLAIKEPSISFIHSYPGIVSTGFGRGDGFLTETFIKITYLLLWPFSVGLGESGERHLYALTSPTFPPKSSGGIIEAAGVNKAALGSEGEAGSGAYLLGWDQQPVTKAVGLIKEYRETGVSQQIWDHTQAIFVMAKRARGAES